MALTRRGFLGALATGAVGLCVAAKAPTGWLPAAARESVACEYMRKRYHAWVKGRAGFAAPYAMVVTRDLYEAFQGELVSNLRFRSVESSHLPPHLMFKGARVFPKRDGAGWRIVFYTREEFARVEYATNTTGRSL